MSDSDAPGTDTSNGITLKLKGKSMRIIATIVLSALGVSGVGVAGFRLASEDYVNASVQAESKRHEEATVKQEATDERQDEVLVEHSVQIHQVQTTVDEIQTVQHKQFSRDEAARITEKIQNRRRREQEYDRLVDRNMRRLKRGLSPCSTVDCSE